MIIFRALHHAAFGLLLFASVDTAAEPLRDNSLVRAQLKARQMATISAGVSGEILQLVAQEGGRVSSGELIVQLDCAQTRAHRRISEAKLSAAQAKSRVAERLVELNSAGALDAVLAKAEVAVISSEIAALDTYLRKCEIRAPFSGVVVTRMAQPHQFVREGEAIVELIDTDRLEAEMVAPSSWLSWLSVGTPFRMQVDETGLTVMGRVERIAGRIDPVSRTIRLLGVIVSSEARLLPGMSGSVSFERSSGGNDRR